jgi:SAM-dependent methyltransferase
MGLRQLLTGRADAPVDPRCEERLRAHWEIERELADRLRNADREERSVLYGQLYDELFRRVPDHPQLQWREDAESRRARAAWQTTLLSSLLPPNGIFLEVGAGDCSLSLALAEHAGQVYAIEVSHEIPQASEMPGNFELLTTDGLEIPVPPGIVDLAYSDQVMEHLHPDDAAEQLTAIARAIRPGGRYLCRTPHRLLGPADISMYFEDDGATGFHLREYTNRELRDLFVNAGFATVEAIAVLRGRIRTLPCAPFIATETAFGVLPAGARRRLKGRQLAHTLLSPGGGVIGTKA